MAHELCSGLFHRDGASTGLPAPALPATDHIRVSYVYIDTNQQSSLI